MNIQADPKVMHTKQKFLKLLLLMWMGKIVYMVDVWNFWITLYKSCLVFTKLLWNLEMESLHVYSYLRFHWTLWRSPWPHCCHSTASVPCQDPPGTPVKLGWNSGFLADLGRSHCCSRFPEDPGLTNWAVPPGASLEVLGKRMKSDLHLFLWGPWDLGHFSFWYSPEGIRNF